MNCKSFRRKFGRRWTPCWASTSPGIKSETGSKRAASILFWRYKGSISTGTRSVKSPGKPWATWRPCNTSTSKYVTLKLTKWQKLTILFQANNITELPKAAFGHLPVIFEINMANNQISNISVRAFEGLLQVLLINMTHNNISHIPNGALQGRSTGIDSFYGSFPTECSRIVH